MALLIVLLSLLISPCVFAQDLGKESFAIWYDRGNPDRSVGVLGNTLIRIGDFYKGHHILAFEKNGVVLEDVQTQDRIKLICQGDVDEELYQHALYVFVVGQMEAIHEAQTRYLVRFHDHFASTLEALIQHGFLADGFEEGVKNNYRFEIVEVRKEYGEEPTYVAIASPTSAIGPNLFFAVDQLGSVRYGDSRYHVPWGAVWEYADHSGPTSEFISVGDEA